MSILFFRTGPVCQMSGILDVWGYNETKINGLTDAQILADLNKVPLIRYEILLLKFQINDLMMC